MNNIPYVYNIAIGAHIIGFCNMIMWQTTAVIEYIADHLILGCFLIFQTYHPLLPHLPHTTLKLEHFPIFICKNISLKNIWHRLIFLITV